MSKYFSLWIILFFSVKCFGQKNITIKFEAIANGKKIVLSDSVYENKYGEKYTVSKLKFYISNFNFSTKGCRKYSNQIFLIDAATKDSFTIRRPEGRFFAVMFNIGVDSILNCSGAQSGALDPLNDMFWTWNSGYVNFKLEGKSENSTAINNKVEQHIGGYIAPYQTLQRIYLPIPKNYFFNNNTLTIQLDLNKYWEGIKIAETPVIAAPGALAKKAADNFTKMFSLKK